MFPVGEAQEGDEGMVISWKVLFCVKEKNVSIASSYLIGQYNFHPIF